MQNQIYDIINDMSEHLSITQMKALQQVLIKRLEESYEEVENIELMRDRWILRSVDYKRK